MHPRSTSYKFNQDSNLLGDHKVQCCIVNFSSLSLMSSIIAIGPCQRNQIFVLKKTCFSRPMRNSTFWCERSIIRSSINYAKDWLDQSVSHICMWSLGVSQHPFSCVLGQFQHDGDKQPTEQPNWLSWSKPALDQWKDSLLQFLDTWPQHREPDWQTKVGPAEKKTDHFGAARVFFPSYHWCFVLPPGNGCEYIMI